MAINKKEMEFEQHKLEETKGWIDKQISLADEKEKELENKVAMLKKSSGGKYSDELALTQQVHGFQVGRAVLQNKQLVMR